MISNKDILYMNQTHGENLLKISNINMLKLHEENAVTHLKNYELLTYTNLPSLKID